MSLKEILKQGRYGKIVRGVFNIFLCACMILTMTFGAVSAEAVSVVSRGGTATVAAVQKQRNPSIKELINATVSLVDDVKAILDDIKNGDLENAKTKTDGIVRNIRTVQTPINKTVKLLGNAFPKIKAQLVNIQNVLSLGEIGVGSLLDPAIEQLQNYPLSEMRVDDGISTAFLGAYIDFAESIMPDIEKCVELANNIDFGMIDKDGKIAECLEAANRLLETYRADKTILATIKAMLGAEEDRLYLLAAQNSAEIRASGGFPGSVGTIRIENGVLKLGDFKPVNSVLAASTGGKISISSVEYRLFGQLSGMGVPRDAGLCPDFERVAGIWAAGYETKNNEKVHGVISMTPCIVQKLLAAVDEEIVLSDGLVLNGDNATKVLQHDLYFKYFGRTVSQDGQKVSDDLFADAANQTMQTVLGNLDMADLLNYATVIKESFADRTLMVWMQNENEQALVRRNGWNAALNTDPQNPQAGVYFNCIIASKMGWFLVMDPQMGERTLNADGSYTYPVTVTFSNAISEEEIKTANTFFILGDNGGNLVGSVYFFAPAGGTVSDFTMSNGGKVAEEVYQDLELGYVSKLVLYPREPVTVTYNVTTAPGVETPLVFSQTPTVQAYHEAN